MKRGTTVGCLTMTIALVCIVIAAVLCSQADKARRYPNREQRWSCRAGRRAPSAQVLYTALKRMTLRTGMRLGSYAVDTVLELVATDDGFRFVLDGQTSMIEDWCEQLLLRGQDPAPLKEKLAHYVRERRVLVGDMGVERPPWAAAVFRIDVAGALGLAAGAEVLAVRR